MQQQKGTRLCVFFGRASLCVFLALGAASCVTGGGGSTSGVYRWNEATATPDEIRNEISSNDFRLKQAQDGKSQWTRELQELQGQLGQAQRDYEDSYAVKGEITAKGVKSGATEAQDNLRRIQGEIAEREERIRECNYNITVASGRRESLNRLLQSRTGGWSAPVKAASGGATAPAGDKVGCFMPGTKVVMGNRATRDVSAVGKGDTVLAYDEASGEFRPARVLSTFTAEQNHVYEINRNLRVTGAHRFLTREGWKRAYDLKAGDAVRSEGGFVPVTTIERVEPASGLTVYNLEVEEVHTFVVSDGARPYVVHNTGGGGK